MSRWREVGGGPVLEFPEARTITLTFIGEDLEHYVAALEEASWTAGNVLVKQRLEELRDKIVNASLTSSSHRTGPS